MYPIASERLSPLHRFYYEVVEPKTRERKELYQLRLTVEEALNGKSFKAKRAWETQNPDGKKPSSYADWVETNELGGPTTREFEAWRRDFLSKSAQHELRHSNGLAHVDEPYLMSQRDVGPIKGPSFRDDILSPPEMRGALVKHCVDILTTNEARLVKTCDWRQDELLLWLFAQFKAGDLEHRKPRWVLNQKISNEPAQSIRNRRKKRSGAPASRATTTPQDLAVVVDAKKGYKQIGITDATGRKQRFLIPVDVWLEACARAESQNLSAAWPNSSTRIVSVRHVDHVVLQPTTLQFGGATSSDVFTDRLGLPLAVLRQYGFRLETQIDDIELKSRHGPSTLLIELCLTMLHLAVYGWMLHCSGEKADQTWPRSVWIFDGVEMRAMDLMTFSPADRDQRHREELRQYLAKDLAGEPQDLRRLATVLGQQVSHRGHHYPTALVLPRAASHLSGGARRLASLFGVLEAWSKTARPLPSVARNDLRVLLEPRLVGEHMRVQTGVALAQITVDASSIAAGYQMDDLRTGTRLTGTMTMDSTERFGVHHTHQELTMTARVAQQAILQLDLHGTETPAASTILVRNDNTAALKNLTNPGNKPAMTEPTVGMHVLARLRGLYPIAVYVEKYYMDVISKVDYMSRPKFRFGDLGLQPRVLEVASSRLGVPITEAVDGLACRATRQPMMTDFITRYPSLGAWKQNDIRSYDLAMDPRLASRTLYLFPPEVLIADLVHKLSTERRSAPTILVVPKWQKTPSWWPSLVPLICRYVTVAPNDLNYVQPGAPEVIIDPPLWTLIICVLSSSDCETAACSNPTCQTQSCVPMWMGRVEAFCHGETLQRFTMSSKHVGNEATLNC